MCNFYIMYYVKGDRILRHNNCGSWGPPNWYLNDFRDSNDNPLDLEKMPKDASEIPDDQKEILKNGGGHAAHGNKHESMKEEEMKMKEDMSSHHQMPEHENSIDKLKTILLSNKIKNKQQASLLSTLLDEYDSQQVKSDESEEDSDEFVSYLESLENEYNLRKLLKEYNLN